MVLIPVNICSCSRDIHYVFICGVSHVSNVRFPGCHRFESLMPRINETKLVTDMLWKSYEVRTEPRNVFLCFFTKL
jgi:hypothetical protein